MQISIKTVVSDIRGMYFIVNILISQISSMFIFNTIMNIIFFTQFRRGIDVLKSDNDMRDSQFSASICHIRKSHLIIFSAFLTTVRT